MISRAGLSSFPIGLNWSFTPDSILWLGDRDESTSPLLHSAFDVWSLPLEAIMLYGGPMQRLLKTLTERYQIVFRSHYRGYLKNWNSVHRNAFEEVANDNSPAYIVFEDLALAKSQLGEFEREILKVSDAIAVLSVPIQIENETLLYDEIWLQELLTRTRLQLSLPLDKLFSKINSMNFKLLKPQLEQFFEIIFADPLRVAEIKVAAALPEILPASKAVSAEALQFEAWRDLIFDFDASSTIIWDWQETLTPPEILEHWLKSSLALRGSVLNHLEILKVPPTQVGVGDEPLTKFELAFQNIFVSLVKLYSIDYLRPIVASFQNWLSQQRPEESEIHEEMRYWPMFLKSEKPEAIDSTNCIALSLRDWALFSARFHPADETAEQTALDENEFKVNPTIQPVTINDELSIIFRRQHLLTNELSSERKITWDEAAILDEIQENFKLRKADLLTGLLSKRSPSGDFKNEEFWWNSLKSLVREGLVLSRTLLVDREL